ncbi:MAG: DUF2262 domain-containing protein [Pleurocapsa minor GSE-CHR-MK-17-07R]|nr:DUF2262 domain-containing protein [Pleurocapsa minor GSE-CHR-MK 17-07R]
MSVQNLPIIVVGLVSPFSCGAVRRTSDIWTLKFKFYAWRGPDGVLRRDSLLVHGDMIEEALQQHMNQIRSYNIIAVSVVLQEDGSAVFLELIGDRSNADDELQQVAADMLKPRTYEHPQLGVFTFNRDSYCWENSLDWAGSAVTFSLNGDETPVPDTELLQTAMTLFDQQAVWSQRVSEYAVQELLQLKNNVWLDEDEAPLTPQDFVARMKLVTISIDGGDSLGFWHDDGDLFWGHTILISGSLHDGPTDAEIAG